MKLFADISLLDGRRDAGAAHGPPLVGILFRDERRLLWTAMAAFVVLITTLEPGDWGRRPWRQDYFGVEPPAISQPDRTIILLAGYHPTAYLIPFFPRQVRFLRVQGYFTGPSPVPNDTDRRMQNIVAGHNGHLSCSTPPLKNGGPSKRPTPTVCSWTSQPARPWFPRLSHKLSTSSIFAGVSGLSRSDAASIARSNCQSSSASQASRSCSSMFMGLMRSTARP